MDAHACVRVCSMPVSACARVSPAAFSKSSGRASFMTWALDAAVCCVHVCMYVHIALLSFVGSFSDSECALAFMRWYIDARTAGAFVKALCGMIHHLAATILGASAYQHHLSGGLFLLTHIYLLRAVIFPETARNKLSVLVCSLLGTMPDSRHGDGMLNQLTTFTRSMITPLPACKLPIPFQG